MNYLISKATNDERKGICGVMIPDGFFTVVQLTFENQEQLKNIMNLPGDRYAVTKTALPEGHYAPNGCRVTLESLWAWYLYKEELVYLDEIPADGTAEVPRPGRNARPPNMDDRPEYIGLDDLGADDETVLPEAVRLARKRIADQEAAGAIPQAVARVSHETDSEIDLENDETTLLNAGATDELAMLRAALDARSIKYSPTAKAPNLRKKLEEANAA